MTKPGKRAAKARLEEIYHAYKDIKDTITEKEQQRKIAVIKPLKQELAKKETELIETLDIIYGTNQPQQPQQPNNKGTGPAEG